MQNSQLSISPVVIQKMNELVTANSADYEEISLPVKINDALELLNLDFNDVNARRQVKTAIKQLQIYKNQIENKRIEINSKIEAFIKSKINDKAKELKQPVIDAIEKLQNAVDSAEAEEKRKREEDKQKKSDLLLYRTKALMERGFVEVNGEYKFIVPDNLQEYAIPVMSLPTESEQDFSKLLNEVATAKSLYNEREIVRKKIEEEQRKAKEKEEQELREKLKAQEEELKKQYAETGQLRYDSLIMLREGVVIAENKIMFNGVYVCVFNNQNLNAVEYLGSITKEQFYEYKEQLVKHINEVDEFKKAQEKLKTEREAINQKFQEVINKCAPLKPFLNVSQLDLSLNFSLFDGDKPTDEKRIWVAYNNYELLDSAVESVMAEAQRLKDAYENKKRLFQLFAERKPSFFSMGLSYNNATKYFTFQLDEENVINVCTGSEILIKEEEAYLEFYKGIQAKVEALKKKKYKLEQDLLSENQKVKNYLQQLLDVTVPVANKRTNKAIIKCVVDTINEQIDKLK